MMTVVVVQTIGWIFVGLIAGALANLIMPRDDPGGIKITILIGIVGACLGGWAGIPLTSHTYGTVVYAPVFNIWNTSTATLGAIIPLAIYVSMRRRRTQQRSEEQLRPRQSEEQWERTGEDFGLRKRQTKGIFISYRRDESAGYAGRIADRFIEHFGKDRVFRDLDTLEPGLDFAEVIQSAVDSTEVMIAVIGKNWLTATDAAGRKRLEKPDDYVRVEIATALQRNTRVIPLLVQGASMPSADELPEDLAPLTRRNAFELHDFSWNEEVKRLITTLDKVLGRRPV